MPSVALTLPEALKRAIAAYNQSKFSEVEQLCYAMIAAKHDFFEALQLGVASPSITLVARAPVTRLTARRPHREISHPLVMAPCASSACLRPAPRPRCPAHP